MDDETLTCFDANNHEINVTVFKNVWVIFYSILLDCVTRDSLSVGERSVFSVNSHNAAVSGNI